MAKDKIPIAVFAYNRPKHLQATLASLSRCKRLEDCNVTIFCDDAKSPEHDQAVQDTRMVARDWVQPFGGEVIERDHNLGLAHSIVMGVTQACEQYGKVIVVEDDLIVGPDFLHFMIEALDRYELEPKVCQISGYLFSIAVNPRADAFFLPMTTTWGWATWARAWSLFDWNAAGSGHKLSDPVVRSRFNLGNSYPYAEMLQQRLAGQNDSWGILWWWAVFQAGGLVLYPRSSLVQNCGFDGTGTHCGKTRRFKAANSGDWTASRYPLVLSDRIETDSEIYHQVVEYLSAKQSLIARILCKLRLK
jgi:hypothetical protein